MCVRYQSARAASFSSELGFKPTFRRWWDAEVCRNEAREKERRKKTTWGDRRLYGGRIIKLGMRKVMEGITKKTIIWEMLSEKNV